MRPSFLCNRICLHNPRMQSAGRTCTNVLDISVFAPSFTDLSLKRLTNSNWVPIGRCPPFCFECRGGRQNWISSSRLGTCFGKSSVYQSVYKSLIISRPWVLNRTTRKSLLSLWMSTLTLQSLRSMLLLQLKAQKGLQTTWCLPFLLRRVDEDVERSFLVAQNLRTRKTRISTKRLVNLP